MSLFPNLGDMVKNLVAGVKAKLAKLDLDKNGVPDLDEVVADLGALEKAVAELASKVTPEEAFTAVNLLLPGKFTQAEVTALFSALAKGVAALAKAQALLANFEKVL